jgi:hypothetical protein
VDLASQVEPVFTAAAETDTQRVPDATAPATSGKVGQESEATLAPAPTAAVTAATVAATSAAAAAATKPAPTPAPTAGSSSTTSALPENPPIKQAGMDYYPTRKTKKSKGARAVSIVMKVIAVLVWIAAIAILIGARDVLGAAFNPFSFDALVDVLTNNETVKSGISFIIFGFLFFGVAVIIGLLGDIRRGVR